MLGWSLYFKINFIITSATFSKLELLSTQAGILRFVTMFEKKEFKVFATSLSYEIISLFSTNVICSLETILFERKGFTVFLNVLLSHTFFHLKCQNILF